LPALPTIGWKSALNDATIASYRFRVMMPATGLVNLGYQAGPLELFGADKCDVVVFSKSYSPADIVLARNVRKRGGRVIFDLCDNHFYNPFGLRKYEEGQARIRTMMSIANRTICTTDVLSRIIAEESGVKAMVVEDAVEKLKVRRRPRENRERLELLWFGSHGSPNAPGGMEDLGLIEGPLSVLAEQRAVTLTVCSNNEAKFQAVTSAMPFATRYVEWTPEAFAAAIRLTDAVVIPVNRNPFTDSKSHNRLTSALYAGVPVVATGIESYREFADYCVLDDWDNGLQGLATDLDGRTARAIASRRFIDQKWSTRALSDRWIEALELPSPPGRSAQRPSKKKPVEPPRYQGRLDPVGAGAVTGWVRNITQPAEPVVIDLEVDGERVASAVADIPRPDLDAVGLSPSNCGFSIFSSEIRRGQEQHLTVRARPTGWVIGKDPILAEGPDAFPVSEDLRTDELYSPQRSKTARSSLSIQEGLLTDFGRIEQMFGQLRTLMMKSLIAGGDSTQHLAAVRGLVVDFSPQAERSGKPGERAEEKPGPSRRRASVAAHRKANMVRPTDGNGT
jgi:hypothetical protein